MAVRTTVRVIYVYVFLYYEAEERAYMCMLSCLHARVSSTSAHMYVKSVVRIGRK